MKVCRYLVALVCAGISSASMWIETTQMEFRDSQYECNIYASHMDGGAMGFNTPWDLNGDGYLDVVVSNEMACTSYVYWGSASGFSALQRTGYPLVNGGNCESADLNSDGYPDLVFASIENLIRIFWGTANGPDPDEFTDLPINSWNETCYVADFNKDGYLDIAVGHYDGANGAVFWGGSTGFAANNYTLLPGGGRHNFEVADFDKNGWLDLLFTQQLYLNSLIYWGDVSGFDPNNVTALRNPGWHTHGCSVADLDKNNWLDIVLTCFGGDSLFIYSGSNSGFHLWKALVPGPCYGGTTIADLNKDGHLDIVCARGYGVEMKPLVYWGSSTGYSDSNQSLIGVPVDASGILAADYNNDGHYDLMIHNYAYPPEPSYLLMGPGYVPQYSLPSVRDHHGRFREIGNVYDRGYYEEYVSSIFDAQTTVHWNRFEWDAILPSGTSILFWIRTGDTDDAADSWTEWMSVKSNASIPRTFIGRYLQYKAQLKYTNPCHLPTLEEVRVTYTPTAPIVQDDGVNCVPNPIVRTAELSFHCSSGKASAKIYGIDGALICELKDITYQDGRGVVVWDRRDNAGRLVPRGVYLLNIQDEGHLTTHKLVVLE
ncbi:MAG: T9SS type A sorting domain-containing protein [candidate division WOR-3 bacterium]|nr:MAG: T9SS type A sorting domain-containing protein [candidate division WOR-3 bacterium]